MQAQKQLTPFEQALVDSILNEHKSLPVEDELPNEFSPGFLRWSRKLLSKTRNPAWYYVNTAFKKAIIVAIVVGMLAVTAMAVPAIREAIIDFFLTEREESYGITFDPEEAADAPEDIQIKYIPHNLPAEFVLIDEITTSYSIQVLWITEEGKTIVYTQGTIPQDATNDSWIGIDAEGVTRTSQIIDEYLVEIVWLEESYSLHWTDNAYVYSLELPNNVSPEEMVGIFNSIKPME